MHSKYTCTTCALIARSLLDVSLIALSCKRGIIHQSRLYDCLFLIVSAAGNSLNDFLVVQFFFKNAIFGTENFTFGAVASFQ